MTEGSLALERRVDGCALLFIDVPGEPVNTLSADLLGELESILGEIEADPAIRAVVVASRKSGGFIAGADLKLLRSLDSADQASELSRTGQAVLGRIASSNKPFVAAIHGPCLGGGLELTLACRARVASDDARTRLGLPEVQLGLLPGLGGTQRLPRLLGVVPALDLVLTGRAVSARSARRLGLVAEVVPKPVLLQAASRLGLKLAQGAERRPEQVRESLQRLLLEKNPVGRRLVFRRARSSLRAKTHGNYPAPERILEVVEAGLAHGMERGFSLESRAFGELLVTAEARELIGLFFASNEAKKDTGVDDPSVSARPVHKVGVLGAGLMGAGIAYVSVAEAGIGVRLKDRDGPSLARGLKTVRDLLDERVKRRRLTPVERDRLMAQVTPSTDYSGFSDAELVIEAVFEDLSLKRAILNDIERAGHPEAIFASNTSSLPLTEIAEGSAHPERVVGMHYFSPVPKMPLLEVVTTDRTLPWVTATAVAVGKRQGKTVIVVRDGAGFYTSRILGPYMNEALYLLEQGVAVEAIDLALVRWGFPVGPITLLDEVGIDVGAKVVKILGGAFGDRMLPPAGIERLLADQRLGRKNRRGFYRYGDVRAKAKKTVDSDVYRILGVEPGKELPPGDVAQRCALMMVNEAVRCYHEKIIRSPRDGDLGAVFGLGFPPFRGGPFRYADFLGAAELVRWLRAYQTELGPRFEPAPLLVQMAEQGQSFYGDPRAAGV